MSEVLHGSAGVNQLNVSADKTQVYGLSGNDTLISNGKSEVLLIGGSGDDSLIMLGGNGTLSGGKGSDIFVYNGGNDIITDYAKQDKISISGENLSIESYSIDDDKNLVLSFADGGNLTIIGGAGKAINFVEKKKTTTSFYETVGAFDGKKKSVVLSGAENTFSAAKYSKLVTIDASNVNDYMDITGNSKANSIIASGFGGTLNGGKGKDTLIGREYMEDVFVYENKGGKDVIENYGSGDKISLGSGVSFKDSKFKKDNAIIKFKSGSITVNNAKDVEVTLTSSTENETIYSNGVFIDQVNSVAKVYGSYKGSIDLNAYDYYVITADATEAKKKISLLGNGDNNILFGGKGKDTLTGGEGVDIFVYNAGDGDDVITNYAEVDTISIKGDTLSKAAAKNGDLIFTLASRNKITIKGGDGKVITYVDDSGEHTYPEETFKFNAKGTAVTLTADYAKDEFDVADYEYKNSVVTIDASATDQDISITANKKNNSVVGGAGNDSIYGGKGNDNLLGGKGADVLLGEDGADTLEGGAGNDTLTGGKGADVFVYTKGDGNDKITDYDDDDMISIKSAIVNKVSTSKDKKDIIFTLDTKNKITITGGVDKVISYVDSEGEHVYPEPVKFNGKGTAATLLASYVKDNFDLADYDDYKDSVVNIDASAVNHDISITANKLANKIIGSEENDYIDGGNGADSILGGKGADTLVGDNGDDTLEGGTGNDSLTGGKGADVFVYNKGDGNDIITDYAEDDTISIKSDTVNKTTTKNGDVVFTLTSKGKITVAGGADKVINYVDADGEHTYPESVKFNSKGTAVTLTSDYTKDEFNIGDYDDYKDSVKVIDASAVEHDLSITGNKLANKITGTEEDDYISGGNGKDTILGGDGNDTLEGGKGNDNLTGGEGSDVFVYASGGGNDVIADFTTEDKIVISSGTISKITSKNSDVIIKIGSGKITVKNSADKTIPIYDATDKVLAYYSPSNNFLEDDESFTLSELVKEKSYDVLATPDINFTADKSYIPVIAQSNKK